MKFVDFWFSIKKKLGSLFGCDQILLPNEEICVLTFFTILKHITIKVNLY